MILHVAQHAIQRYRERVKPVGDADAQAALTGPAIQRAAEFGARHVILGGGQRVVIEGWRIVTVLPKRWSKGCTREMRG